MSITINLLLEQAEDSSFFEKKGTSSHIVRGPEDHYRVDPVVQKLVDDNSFYVGIGSYEDDDDVEVFFPQYNLPMGNGASSVTPRSKDDYKLLARQSIDFLVDYQHCVVDEQLLGTFDRSLNKQLTESILFELTYHRIMAKSAKANSEGVEYVPTATETELYLYGAALLLSSGESQKVLKASEYLESINPHFKFNRNDAFEIAYGFPGKYHPMNKIVKDQSVD